MTTAAEPVAARRFQRWWSLWLATFDRLRDRLRTGDDRVSRLVRPLTVVVLFTTVSVVLRGGYVGASNYLNPDEVELLAQGLAARQSPVPFTTWTTATTGPVWPLFLALLAFFGFPLTTVFAHLLAAVLLGLIGAFGHLLIRRVFGGWLSLAVTAFLWLPLVLVLTGGPADFANLETELLPVVLLLAAALLTPTALSRRPALFIASGLLCGLAVGAKYQALPVALALLAGQVITTGRLEPRRIVRRCALWVAGAVLPAAVVVLAMLLSPDVSWALVGQALNYLTAYSGELTLGSRFWGAFYLTISDHLVLLEVLVAWLALRSTVRIGVLRLGIVFAGFLAAFAGGYAWSHYQFLIYGAVIVALGLPVRPGLPAFPPLGDRRRATATVLIVAVFGWLVSFGPTLGQPELTSPRDLAVAFSADSVDRNARLIAACPPGSQVMVWGWGSELYSNNSWRNAIPVFNTLFWTYPPANREAGYAAARAAIESPDTDCVVDAVGRPFFGHVPSLTDSYPQLGEPLARLYRTMTLIDCERCTIYVRTDEAARP